METKTTPVAPLGLRQAQGKLSVRTNGQGLFEITPEVAAWGTVNLMVAGERKSGGEIEAVVRRQRR